MFPFQDSEGIGNHYVQSNARHYLYNCFIFLNVSVEHSTLAICHSPLATQNLSLTTSPFVTHHSLLVTHYSSFTTHYLPLDSSLTAHDSLLATRHSPLTPCRSLVPTYSHLSKNTLFWTSFIHPELVRKPIRLIAFLQTYLSPREMEV